MTLACTREQEEAGYIYHQDGLDSLERLKELCPIIPVHCILGSRIDLVSVFLPPFQRDESYPHRLTGQMWYIKASLTPHRAVRWRPSSRSPMRAIWSVITPTSTIRTYLSLGRAGKPDGHGACYLGCA